jgi:hypothetical protein
MKRLASVPAVVARLVGAALALAIGVGAVDVADGPAQFITYAGRSNAAAALTLSAGLTLVVAALGMQLARRAGRLVDLLLLASATWFAPVWVGWTDGSPIVRSAAAALSGFTFPLLLHATLAQPSGRVGRRSSRVLIGIAYGEASLTAVALALFRDPYFDPSCWANCSVNSFLVTSRPSFVHDVEVADRWSVVAIAIAFCGACAVRLLT